jgi:hypothetical protein
VVVGCPVTQMEREIGGRSCLRSTLRGRESRPETYLAFGNTTERGKSQAGIRLAIEISQNTLTCLRAGRSKNCSQCRVSSE